MDLGWLWLVLGTFFTLYSFDAWKKDQDQQWKHLGILGIAVIALLISRLLLVDLFPEQFRSIVKGLVWAAWIPVLIAFVVIVVKGRKK